LGERTVRMTRRPISDQRDSSASADHREGLVGVEVAQRSRWEVHPPEKLNLLWTDESARAVMNVPHFAFVSLALIGNQPNTRLV
jgi:hypothetical protein